MRGPSTRPPLTASRTVASTNHLPPGTEMPVTPAARIFPTTRAVQSVAYSGVEVKRTPGSAPWCEERCTCPSIRPGMMCLPAASITASPGSLRLPCPPTYRILFPSTTIVSLGAGDLLLPSMRVPFLMISRFAAMPSPSGSGKVYTLFAAPRTEHRSLSQQAKPMLEKADSRANKGRTRRQAADRRAQAYRARFALRVRPERLHEIRLRRARRAHVEGRRLSHHPAGT